jgi:hypothetical protein
VLRRSRALRPRAPPPALQRRSQHPSQPPGPFSGRPLRRPLPHIAALLCRHHLPHGAFRAPPSIGNAKAAAPTAVATRRLASWRRPGQGTPTTSRGSWGPAVSFPGLCHTVAACPLRVARRRASPSLLHRRGACGPVPGHSAAAVVLWPGHHTPGPRQHPGSTQGESLVPRGRQAAAARPPSHPYDWRAFGLGDFETSVQWPLWI